MGKINSISARSNTRVQDLRLQCGRAALMRILEVFWGTRRRNAEHSLDLLMSFLISPASLQEVCLNGYSVAGCRCTDDGIRCEDVQRAAGCASTEGNLTAVEAA